VSGLRPAFAAKRLRRGLAVARALLRPSAGGAGGRGWGLGAGLLLILLVAACGAKPVTEPAPAGAPKFPDFVVPTTPANLAPQDVMDQQARAWAFLQAGDTKEADRQFGVLLKAVPAFYPAEAGLGYSALARKDASGAIAHFDKALADNASYAPALAGKGDALLAQGHAAAARDSFEAAIKADPALAGTLTNRIEVLTFRGQQDALANARKAADAGHLDEARSGYLAAIAASPQSAFLYRELAGVEHKSGDDTSALAHAQQATQLDPTDTHALLLIAQIYEGQQAWAKAADAYTALNAAEPSDATSAKIDDMRAKVAFDAMPDDYKAIAQSPTVTRAQLAALLGVRLEDLLRRPRQITGSVVTDVRGQWAAPWILSVTRAGVMDPFSNHTFQPSTIVRRGDLAQAVSRVLGLIANDKPKLAAKWADARPRFSDVAPSHLSYPAAARAVSAGIMSPLEGNTFQLTRPVTGSEAIDAVTKLQALARK
jgi:tetratricopeptide (TPR) repeat protein